VEARGGVDPAEDALEELGLVEEAE